MSIKAFYFVFVLFASLTIVFGDGFGYRVARTFFDLTDLPLTTDDANNAGWTQNGDCSNDRGILFEPSSGITKTNPISLYFTSGGQFAGWTLYMFGQAAQNLINLGYWESGDGTYYSLSLSTRNTSMMCSGTVDSQTAVGDQLIINQGGANFPIPLNTNDASSQNWYSGGCIKGMGTHWSYDVSTPGNMTWLNGNLLPVMPMFMNGAITAVLINSPNVQTVWPIGIWEGPFINSLFCYNWCPTSGCTFDNTFWTTTHFLFDDKSSNYCNGNECPSAGNMKHFIANIN